MIANPNIQRVDRKQLYYSTTEGSDDKIQVCNQVSERSRRRYDGVAVLIKFFNGDTVMGKLAESSDLCWVQTAGQRRCAGCCRNMCRQVRH